MDTHAQAEVQQEEDVEGHVDLQREVLVEVLTRLDRAGHISTQEEVQITSLKRDDYK